MTHSRFTGEQVVNAYRETGSIWKAAKVLGLAGQTVHERLRALGYPMAKRSWTSEEDAELGVLLAAGLPAGEVASRLGRTFAAVTCRMNALDLRVQRAQVKTLPRGAGYDKVSIGRHLSAIERSNVPPTRYCRANALEIEMFVQACQRHFPDRWTAYVASHSALPTRTCPYCGTDFIPMSGKQRFCTRQCGSAARVDNSYFGGRRRETIGLAEGICQLCGVHKTKGMSSHHVLGKDNDPENGYLIALCQGCHKVVTMLSTRNFIDDGTTWQTLIELCWWRKHGADVAAGKFDGQALYTYVEIEVDDEDDETYGADDDDPPHLEAIS